MIWQIYLCNRKIINIVLTSSARIQLDILINRKGKMDNELQKLKKCIESSIIDERNHIFKYTTPLVSPQSSQAKVVFLEYDRVTSNDRCHNYNLRSIPYDSPQLQERKIPNFFDFLANKILYHSQQDRKSYVMNGILSAFRVFDEDGYEDGIEIQDYDFNGETNHEIFRSWLLFDYLFELSIEISKSIKRKCFSNIPELLELIDNNFGFLMGRKDSHFQLKMDEDELHSWLLAEIISLQHLIEEKGLWKSLNKEPEKHFQWVFSAALSRVSELFGVYMCAEPDVGSGKVDFIFSQGNNSKVCVELKLATSQKVFEGYT